MTLCRNYVIRYTHRGRLAPGELAPCGGEFGPCVDCQQAKKIRAERRERAVRQRRAKSKRVSSGLGASRAERLGRASK